MAYSQTYWVENNRHLIKPDQSIIIPAKFEGSSSNIAETSRYEIKSFGLEY